MTIEETERKPVYDLDCNFNYNVMCRASDIASGMCDKCGWNPREQRRRKAYDKDPIQFDPWKAREGLRELKIQRWRRAHGFVDPVEEAEREQEEAERNQEEAERNQEDPEEDRSEPEDET